MARESEAHGFTLVELMISTSLIGVAGTIFVTFLYTGSVLFAKNTAVNLAHQQARTAVLYMQQDIHSAISIPQLVDSSRSVVSGTGPAAGISFLLYAGGPFKIHNNQQANNNNVQIDIQKAYTPMVGQRLIIPTCQIELDVTSVSGNGNTVTVFLSQPIGKDIVVTNGGGSHNVPCFFADRVSYVVVNNQLRYYGRANNNSCRVLSNNITNAAPFGVPITQGGAPYNRFIAAIDLSTADMKSNNRGFKSANMFLNSSVPVRATLTTSQ